VTDSAIRLSAAFQEQRSPDYTIHYTVRRQTRHLQASVAEIKLRLSREKTESTCFVRGWPRVRDAEVGGSNPLSPTLKINGS
jgi:hypothetical protein